MIKEGHKLFRNLKVIIFFIFLIGFSGFYNIQSQGFFMADRILISHNTNNKPNVNTWDNYYPVNDTIANYYPLTVTNDFQNIVMVKMG